MRTEGSLKGGFRRPSFGIMNFWFVAGIEREEETASERSAIVAEVGRVSVMILDSCIV